MESYRWYLNVKAIFKNFDLIIVKLPLTLVKRLGVDFVFTLSQSQKSQQSYQPPLKEALAGNLANRNKTTTNKNNSILGMNFGKDSVLKSNNT
jgi:hypothetical protein